MTFQLSASGVSPSSPLAMGAPQPCCPTQRRGRALGLCQGVPSSGAWGLCPHMRLCWEYALKSSFRVGNKARSTRSTTPTTPARGRLLKPKGTGPGALPPPRRAPAAPPAQAAVSPWQRAGPGALTHRQGRPGLSRLHAGVAVRGGHTTRHRPAPRTTGRD